MKIKRRDWPLEALTNVTHLHPVLKRVYAARGILEEKEVNYRLEYLEPYHTLLGIDLASGILSQAIEAQKRFLVIGDFDADGATASAVAVRAMKAFGAQFVDFLVPNRFEYGYGLTPAIVEAALPKKPDIIITVDNGISSCEGVEAAKRYGIEVVITDHHLAGEKLPEASAIVNPNQPNDPFPSKALAGVGVIFYVMLAVRASLSEKGWFEKMNMPRPNMAELLDIVALGTVADVVPLDRNNRTLVHQGLKRIQTGVCAAGITALLSVSGRDYKKINASDLAFSVAPRLNAAGRLEDMSLGIQCLLTNDPEEALVYAKKLDELNQERRQIESQMQQQAVEMMKTMTFDMNASRIPSGVCLYEPSWHQGVIGILAGRMKDRLHRPVIAFADSGKEDELKGSARSIPGIHIRDSLDVIAKKHPNLLEKFGGHAMAAGLTIAKSRFSEFQKVFRQQMTETLKNQSPQAEVLTDGSLRPEDFNLDLAALLRESGPWGQHFPEPLFDSTFVIYQQYLLKGKHLKLNLGLEEAPLSIDAIAFNIDEKHWPNPRCKKIYAVYKLDVNEYQGRRSVQLLIEHLQAV